MIPIVEQDDQVRDAVRSCFRFVLKRLTTGNDLRLQDLSAGSDCRSGQLSVDSLDLANQVYVLSLLSKFAG
jgi:hypothetical protein